MACIHELTLRNGEVLSFNREEDLDLFLMSAAFNIAYSTITNQSEAVETLKNPSKNIKFEDDIGQHEYFYTDPKTADRTQLKPVSTVIEEDLKTKNKYGAMGERGQASQDYGNIFHEVASMVIISRNDKTKLADHYMFKGKKIPLSTGIVKDWVTHVNKLYDQLSDGGKNEVLSEFKIGNLGAKVAGTIDIAVVRPNGSVVLYDIKGTGNEYKDGGTDKSRANNYQLNLYKRMLEVGDPKLGMKPLRVTGAFIIPVEFDFDSEFNLKSFDVSKGLLNIEDDNYFKGHPAAVASAKTLFPVDGSNSVKKGELVMPNSVEFGNVVSGLTGRGDDSTADPRKYAESIERASRWDDVSKSYYYPDGKKKVVYKDPVAAADKGPAGVQARINELMVGVAHTKALEQQGIAKELVTVFLTGSSMLINMDDQSNRAAIRIKEIIGKYNKNMDRMALASDIPGMENVGSDVVVVYKNYNSITGNYTSIDLLSISGTSNLESTQPLAHNKNSIFSNYMSNSSINNYFRSKGLMGSDPWPNNLLSNKYIKLGLLSQELLKANPGVKIGKFMVAGITNFSGSSQVFSRSVEETLEQLNMIRMFHEDSKNTFKIEDATILDNLKDKRLNDKSNYDTDAIQGYFDFIRSSLNNKYDDNARKGQVKDKHLAKWLHIGEVKAVIPDTAEETTQKLIKEIKQDDAKKQQLIDILSDRMDKLIAYKNNNPSEAALNPEVQVLASAIRHLYGQKTVAKYDTDINSFEAYIVKPGKTVNDIYNGYVQVVTEQHKLMGMKYFENYKERSKKVLKKFLDDMGVRRNLNLSGMAHQVYEELLEQVEVEYEGNTKEKVTRFTGRFWTKGTAGYNKLNDIQKRFIEEYNDLIEEGMTRHMDTADKENFKENWVRGTIPAFRTSASTLIKKAVSGDGTLSTKLVTFFQRKADKYGSYGDEVNAEEGMTGIFDRLEGQIGEGGHPVYGNDVRMEILGFNEDGTAQRRDSRERAITSPFETNLEDVLDFTFYNSYRQEYMKPLVILAKSTQIALLVAQHEFFGKQPNVLEALKVFNDAVLNKKNQITKNQENWAKGLGVLTDMTNKMFLGFNVGSWSKNLGAGYFHALSKTWLKARKGADGPNPQHLAKAYGAVMTFKNWDKVQYLMYACGTADMDIDSMVHDSKHKVSGDGIFGNRFEHEGNRLQNYHHRAAILVAQMMYDGVWDAVVETKGKDGTKEYNYDETKDKRFTDTKLTKEVREAKKAFIKKSMKEQGLLDDKGNMKIPYTVEDLTRFSDEMRRAFEPDSVTERGLYTHFLIGKVAGQMRGWLGPKMEQYWTKTGVDNARKYMVQVERTDPDTGETYPDFEWRGTPVEGMFQTVGYLIANIAETIKTADGQNTVEFWANMPVARRENLRKLISDLGIFATLAAAGILLLGGDDEDPWYKMWSKMSKEIFIYDHISAIPGLGEGFAIPALGMIKGFIQHPMDFAINNGSGPFKPFVFAYNIYADSAWDE